MLRARLRAARSEQLSLRDEVERLKLAVTGKEEEAAAATERAQQAIADMQQEVDSMCTEMERLQVSAARAVPSPTLPFSPLLTPPPRRQSLVHYQNTRGGGAMMQLHSQAAQMRELEDKVEALEREKRRMEVVHQHASAPGKALPPPPQRQQLPAVGEGDRGEGDVAVKADAPPSPAPSPASGSLFAHMLTQRNAALRREVFALREERDWLRARVRQEQQQHERKEHQRQQRAEEEEEGGEGGLVDTATGQGREAEDGHGQGSVLGALSTVIAAQVPHAEEAIAAVLGRAKVAARVAKLLLALGHVGRATHEQDVEALLGHTTPVAHPPPEREAAILRAEFPAWVEASADVTAHALLSMAASLMEDALQPATTFLRRLRVSKARHNRVRRAWLAACRREGWEGAEDAPYCPACLGDPAAVPLIEEALCAAGEMKRPDLGPEADKEEEEEEEAERMAGEPERRRKQRQAKASLGVAARTPGKEHRQEALEGGAGASGRPRRESLTVQGVVARLPSAVRATPAPVQTRPVRAGKGGTAASPAVAGAEQPDGGGILTGQAESPRPPSATSTASGPPITAPPTRDAPRAAAEARSKAEHKTRETLQAVSVKLAEGPEFEGAEATAARTRPTETGPRSTATGAFVRSQKRKQMMQDIEGLRRAIRTESAQLPSTGAGGVSVPALPSGALDPDRERIALQQSSRLMRPDGLDGRLADVVRTAAHGRQSAEAYDDVTRDELGVPLSLAEQHRRAEDMRRRSTFFGGGGRQDLRHSASGPTLGSTVGRQSRARGAGRGGRGRGQALPPL